MLLLIDASFQIYFIFITIKIDFLISQSLKLEFIFQIKKIEWCCIIGLLIETFRNNFKIFDSFFEILT